MYMTSITRLLFALSCSVLSLYNDLLKVPSQLLTLYYMFQVYSTNAAGTIIPSVQSPTISLLRAMSFTRLRTPPSRHYHPPLHALNDALLLTHNHIPNLPNLPSFFPSPLPSPYPPISTNDHPLPPLSPHRLHRPENSNLPKHHS